MTTPRELKKQAVIFQTAQYIYDSANDTEQDEAAVYSFKDSCVFYEKVYRLDILIEKSKRDPREKIFIVKIQDLIQEKALQLVPTYDCERDEIAVKSIDNLLHAVYDEFERTQKS